jgi:hypothetical protein
METQKPSPETFQKVIEASELVHVQVQSCSAECYVFPSGIDPKTSKLAISIAKPTWNLSEKKNALFCYLHAEVKCTSLKTSADIKEDDPLFEIKSTVVVTYELSETNLDDSALEYFANRNAMLNGYPFLRETVANLSSRMGVPAAILPLSKPSAGAKPKEQKPDLNAGSSRDEHRE